MQPFVPGESLSSSSILSIKTLTPNKSVQLKEEHSKPRRWALVAAWTLQSICWNERNKYHLISILSFLLSHFRSRWENNLDNLLLSQGFIETGWFPAKSLGWRRVTKTYRLVSLTAGLKLKSKVSLAVKERVLHTRCIDCAPETSITFRRSDRASATASLTALNHR